MLKPSEDIDVHGIVALGESLPFLSGLEKVGDYTASYRHLRLVSKEMHSRLAMRGLRVFTLTLKGDNKDTNIGRASLLQQSNLRELTVHLEWTGPLGWKSRSISGWSCYNNISGDEPIIGKY